MEPSKTDIWIQPTRSLTTKESTSEYFRLGSGLPQMYRTQEAMGTDYLSWG